jgi:hypothetical protein
MSLANDNKSWGGNQSDRTMNRIVKSDPQPPCDLASQHQFEDSQEYIEVKRDRWGNEVPVDWTNHRGATAGMGMFGDQQFAANTEDLQSTGYGKNLGLNVIEYGQGAAFDQAESTVVDVSRGDRGKES